MKIPTNIEEILAQEQGLEGAVKMVISNVEDWLTNQPMVFFPEYTRHDPRHNEEVLHTAVDLATKESLDLLSPKDVAVLILSTALHDSAMHISQEGFLTLVSEDSSWSGISEFDSVSWSTMWQEFLSEAKRFNDQTLSDLFGDVEPTRVPPEKVLDWNDRDKMLIGEFLRRHHARLAHEIAIHGVPSADGSAHHVMTTGLPADIIDLSGLAARSHGMSLRDCFPYLERKYDLQDYQGSHIVFVMLLLRVADYLQIQADRAPGVVRQLRTIKSPISNREWTVHNCITNINTAVMDPEAIKIDASPPDAESFVRVREWLDGIQFELDKGWAVLGEVYGRYVKEGLSDLGLGVRRIRSNIDDLEAYSATVDYVPEAIKFRTADAHLLQLLVRPLYDDDPMIGVRELVQNAVDSVIELEQLIKLGRSNEPRSDRRDIDVNVLASIALDSEGKPDEFRVVDRGVGMSAEIVRDYFLNAGASFRQSENWQRDFEPDGKSSIARTGRFGVGALSAFLLGDTIKVETRRFDQTIGIEFSAKLDLGTIDLRKKRMPIGTVVSVKLNKKSRDIFEGLSARNSHYWDSKKDRYSPEKSHWDFYHGKNPSYGRQIGDVLVAPREDGLLPTSSDRFVDFWRPVEVEGLESVHWSYETNAPNMCCNGIPVPISPAGESDWSSGSRSITWRIPRISIVDHDGAVPLNLARTRCLWEKDIILEMLDDSVVVDFVISELLKKRVSPGSVEFGLSDLRVLHRGFDTRAGPSETWIITTSGLLPLDQKVLFSCGITEIVLIPRDIDLHKALYSSITAHGMDHIGIATTPYESTIRDLKSRFNTMGLGRFPNQFYRYPFHDTILHDNQYVSRTFIDRLASSKTLPVGMQRKINNIDLDSDHVWFNVGNGSIESWLTSDRLLYGIMEDLGKKKIRPMFVGTFVLKEDQLSQSILSRVWSKLMENNAIPFELNERTALLEDIRKMYPEHVEFLESMKG